MTSPNQQKPTPIPAIIVYGTPTSAELTQASWFRAEDIEAAKAAAEALKFSVIELKTDADRALTAGVHEGVLKGSGRMIVGSVTAEVYKRIEEYARKASATGAAPMSPATETAAGKPAAEQNMNLTTASDAPSAPAPKTADPLSTTIKAVAAESSAASPPPKPATPPARDAWDALRVGSYVIAKDWDENGEAIAWWIARIKGFDKENFVIKWLDEPGRKPEKIDRKYIAILHPSFDVAREWDPKP